MKKSIKNKLHNGLLYLITWMMAVAFALSSFMLNVCVPSLKPLFIIVVGVSMLWILSFITINYFYIEGLCEEE